MNGRCIRRQWAAALLLCAGCSSASTEPFARVSVTGTVTLAGESVRWGGITLRGEKNEKTQEQAFASFPIRDGRIVADSGGPGASPGLNDVTVIVYDSDPADESREPVIRGTWTGRLNLESSQPLNINIEPSALEKPAPNT